MKLSVFISYFSLKLWFFYYAKQFSTGSLSKVPAYLGGISIMTCFFAALIAVLVSLAIVPRQVMPWTGLLLMYEWTFAIFSVLFGGYLHIIYKWGKASAVRMGAFSSHPDAVDYDSGKGSSAA